jgi:hypothetical protein
MIHKEKVPCSQKRNSDPASGLPRLITFDSRFLRHITVFSLPQRHLLVTSPLWTLKSIRGNSTGDHHGSDLGEHDVGSSLRWGRHGVSGLPADR